VLTLNIRTKHTLHLYGYITWWLGTKEVERGTKEVERGTSNKALNGRRLKTRTVNGRQEYQTLLSSQPHHSRLGHVCTHKRVQ
jgi:hypothetical protein